MNTVKQFAFTGILLALHIMPFLSAAHGSCLTADSTQAPAIRSNAVSLNLLPMFMGGLEASAERAIGKKYSVRVSGAYYLSPNASGYFNSEISHHEGYRAELQPRYYIKKGNEALQGLYLAPSVSFKRASLDVPIMFTNFTRFQRVSASALGTGLLAGFQTIAPSGMTLDTWMGLSLTTALDGEFAEQLHIGLLYPFQTGLGFRAGLALGFAW